MNKSIIMSCAALLLAARAAHAEVPTWCGAEANTERLRSDQLASDKWMSVLTAIVEGSCSSDQTAVMARAELAQARAGWGKKLHMDEADWADAAAWIKNGPNNDIPFTYAHKTFAELTPLEQFWAIGKGNAEYLADTFGANLSQVGRLGYLKRGCWDSPGFILRSPMSWAVCQVDAELYDAPKALEELRSDKTPGNGAARMHARWTYLEMTDILPSVAKKAAKEFVGDPEYKHILEVARQGFNSWDKTKPDQKLLDLVSLADSAKFFNSRSVLESCVEPTRAQLVAEVAKVPAKELAKLHDETDEIPGYKGFGFQAGPVIGRYSNVMLAAIAFRICNADHPYNNFFNFAFNGSLYSRGPRGAAVDALLRTTFKFDDLTNQVSAPLPQGGPFDMSYVTTGGGVIASVNPEGDKIHVTFQKTSIPYSDCVKDHSTGRISKIRDGKVEYETVCDSWQTKQQNTTYLPATLRKEYAEWLKPGVRISLVGGGVLAVWPSKTAQQPSMLLGAKLK